MIKYVYKSKIFGQSLLIGEIMLKRLTAFVALMLVLAPSAFAEYEYNYNKKGTGYWRDNSNDGNPYNNANYLGMNSPSRVKTRTLDDY